MIITSEHIKQRIRNIEDNKAKDLASSLNLFATSYKIDIEEILSLLEREPNELDKEYKNLEERRQRLKSEMRKLILGE